MNDIFCFYLVRYNSGHAVISVYRCIFICCVGKEMAFGSLPTLDLHARASGGEGVGPKVVLWT